LPNSLASFWTAIESSDNGNKTSLLVIPHFGHTYDWDLLEKYKLEWNNSYKVNLAKKTYVHSLFYSK